MSEFNKGNRAARNRLPASPGTSPRARRNASGQTTGSDIGPGVTIDKLGRISAHVNPRSPLFINAQGQLDIRLGSGVGVDFGVSDAPQNLSTLPGGGPALTTSGGAQTINANTTVIGGGGGGGGGGGTTIINNFFVDEILPWIDW